MTSSGKTSLMEEQTVFSQISLFHILNTCIVFKLSRKQDKVFPVDVHNYVTKSPGSDQMPRSVLSVPR